MSVIQDIRDKYARWAVIAIALSLLGFIMMDAFAGRAGLFSGDGPGNTLGTVNGKDIEYLPFQQKMQQQEAMAAQNNYVLSESDRQQLLSSMWDQEVTNIVMAGEYEKLGLAVTDKEIRGSLLANPPEQFRQQFTDSAGNLNTAALQHEISRMLRDPEQEKQIRNFLLMKKYTAMLTNTVHVPKWLVEKKNVDNSLIASFAYVNIPYSSVPDSAVKVSDEEIEKYIEENKSSFEQKEETRTFDFVSINAAPSSADSAAARNALAELKDSFARVNENFQMFMRANASTMPFYDGYQNKNSIQLANKDSVLSAPVGTVYGPYLEIDPQTRKGMYVITRVLGVKQWADSAKVRHILIASADMAPQGVQMAPARMDSLAKQKADSVLGLIRSGQSFDSLVVQFSADQGSKDKGGVYELTANGQFVPSFVEFSFDHKPGEIGIVKSDYGYHIIEVMSQSGSATAYRIASLSREISASDETDQTANNLANQFAGESRDLEAFNANYDKMLRGKGILKSTATVKPLDSNVPGLQAASRGFVKKIYEAEEGEVLSPEKIGDYYVVAVLKEIRKPGIPTAQQLRPAVEPFLISKKKGERIIKELGQVTSLEDLAAKRGLQIVPMDSIQFENPRALGFEPRVVGAAFNPANKGKLVQPIAGTQGVYVIRVDNVTTVPVNMNVEEQRKMMEEQQKQMLNPQYGGGPVQALKEASSIKDYRYKFY